jgi:hypothetical protein
LLVTRKPPFKHGAQLAVVVVVTTTVGLELDLDVELELVLELTVVGVVACVPPLQLNDQVKEKLLSYTY